MALSHKLDPIRGHIEASSIVPDLKVRFFGIKGEADVYFRRLRMPDHIGDRLLENTE
jgi:hypothetical protein